MVALLFMTLFGAGVGALELYYRVDKLCRGNVNPTTRSLRIQCLGSKREVATWRRRESRTARAALNLVWPRGKASLLRLLCERVGRHMQKFPARFPKQPLLDRPRLEKGPEVST